ncbi:MAG: hypothetical protein ACK40Q_08985 [Pseudothermotoga sp.]
MEQRGFYHQYESFYNRKHDITKCICHNCMTRRKKNNPTLITYDEQIDIYEFWEWAKIETWEELLEIMRK